MDRTYNYKSFSEYNDNESLLFYLSGENGPVADYAKGSEEPNFFSDVSIIEDGVNGKAFQCGEQQQFAYWANGNIYAQRGTLSFFWRSRYPVGPTEFPIFRVGFSDHSSWDAVWLRIDYNGHGFDAFVTDINLSRTRISCTLNPFPQPDEWIHIALSWDENRGICFYVNGNLAGKKDCKAVYYAGLDQFGTHSRIISHWSVQSAFNYIRGGDVDEIKIFDRMLSDTNILSLLKGEMPVNIPSIHRDLNIDLWRNEWWLRHGFNFGDDMPIYIAGKYISVRKVEIHEAYDHKRWWWKATDGIRETTWPGVYNRSRLPGRCDYFILPDWDCYSVSGKEIIFTIPDEQCNYMEISGSAHGKMYVVDNGHEDSILFERKKDHERTFHRLPSCLRNKKISFVNVEQEEPIGDLSAFYVSNCLEPNSPYKQCYKLSGLSGPVQERISPVLDFINTRYMADERMTLLAVSTNKSGSEPIENCENSLPYIHIIVPYENTAGLGLDGVAIDIPPLDVKPTHGEYYPVNIQIKDPIWHYRNLIHFTFLIKPHEAKTVWLDIRDRILPDDKVIYIMVTGANSDYTPKMLSDAQIRLVFKPYEQAKVEHVADRFIQVKDNYSHLVEEYPRSEKYNLYNRFMADIQDLLKVDPNHELGRLYWYDFIKKDKPCFKQSVPADNTPLWAFRQVEYLRYLKRLLNWWIDCRQIEDGEFGGGLSDDGDLTAWWPGPALIGCMPEKIKRSLLLEMEAFFNNGMFTNGLCTIQTDQLHTFEEGIQVLGQCLVLDEGNPKHLERAMETARAIYGITDVNSAGHRHFTTAYYSGSRVAREYPWNFSNPDSYHVLHPGYMIVRYNGNQEFKKLVVELADSLLAHYRDGVMHCVIDFDTDEDEYTSKDREWHLFIAAYEFTSDKKYLVPLKDQVLWNANNLGRIDKSIIADKYTSIIEEAALREYINTKGHIWVDRVVFDIQQIQCDRIGGVAHQRFACYPRHFLSWNFVAPYNDESVAIIVPYADKRKIKVVAYNLEQQVVEAYLSGADVTPGLWRMSLGIDKDLDDQMDTDIIMTDIEFERSKSVRVQFMPRQYTVIMLELISQSTPYWERPDLGISKEDITIYKDRIIAKVHSLGAVDAASTDIVLKDEGGNVLASAIIPPIKAPVDLHPKTADVSISIQDADIIHAYIEIDPYNKLHEITKTNNIVKLSDIKRGELPS